MRADAVIVHQGRASCRPLRVLLAACPPVKPWFVIRRHREAAWTVLRTSYRFDRWVYLPLLLLHLSVALRIGADLAGSPGLREFALHGNIIALTAFIATTIRAVRRGRCDLTAGLDTSGTPPVTVQVRP